MVDREISQKMREPFTVAQTLRLLPSQRIPFSNRTADIDRPSFDHPIASAQITPWPRFCKPRGCNNLKLGVGCDRNASGMENPQDRAADPRHLPAYFDVNQNRDC